MEKERSDKPIAVVDEEDRITGYEEKLKVHLEGTLHRAFSVVVINSDGQWLMHRRALEKYHSGGTWTNTCCSHLTEGESMAQAARERLQAEMGIEAHPEFVQAFHYRAEFENGLIENEIDHIYLAYWDGTPDPDPEEVMDWKWNTTEEIEEALLSRKDDFSAWFRESFIFSNLYFQIRPDLQRKYDFSKRIYLTRSATLALWLSNCSGLRLSILRSN